MGLDTVELIIAVEKSFDIEIPDAAAGAMTTVGDLHQFIVHERQRLVKPDMPPEIVFDLLRNLVCMQLGVAADRVVPEARFVQDLHAD